MEKDKLERRANKGKLQSKLGVEGYNPSAPQYDVPDATALAIAASHHHSASAEKSPSEQVDAAVHKLRQYKVASSGGELMR